jgi:hypothetical protein
MKIRKRLNSNRLVLMVFISVLVLGSVVSSAYAAEQNQKMSEQQQKMEELWKKYNFPGEKHKHLEYFVGDWESVQKIFPSSGEEPRVRDQEIHVESLFGGRFTRAHIKIKANIGGIVPEGIVITGYDNFKQEFFSVTFGNLGTGYFVTSGKLDKTGKIRIDNAVRTNVYTSQEYKVKAITTIINQDKYLYEYYKIDPKGSEFKRMEIIYTRKNKQK